MAVEGIGIQAQILAIQLRNQALVPRAGTNTQGTGNAQNAAVAEDTFTPSTQSNSAQATAQDAGLFQVGQGALTAGATKLQFAPAVAGATPSAAPGLPAHTTLPNAGNAQPVFAKNSAAPANPRQTFTGTLAGQAPAAKAVPAVNVAEQIQFLNATLPSLKLTKVEIQEIDRIATQIQNFNPAAYTDLINQFEALAQQGTGIGTGNSAPNTGSPATQNAPANGKAIGAGS